MMNISNVPLDYQNRISSLLEKVRSNEDRSLSLFHLWEAANSELYRYYFVYPPLQFFPTIQQILLHGPDIADIENITGCLWYLSREHSIRRVLVSADNDLTSILMDLLRSLSITTGARIKEHILKFFSNCSLDNRTLKYLLKDDFGYLLYHKTDIMTFTQFSFSYQSLFNVISAMDNQRLKMILIQYPIARFIYEKLCGFGVDPYRWPERFRGICYWGLNCLMAISSLPAGAANLKQIIQYQTFLPLLASTNQLIEGVKAFFIICNVYADSEEEADNIDADSDEGNVPENPSSFHHITTKILISSTSLLRYSEYCLTTIVDYRDTSPILREIIQRGYAYSIIKVKDVTAAFAHLALPKLNRGIILERPTIIENCLQVIDDFLKNRKQYCAKGQLAPIVFGGGGSEDYESIENILELLYYLSLYYDELNDLMPQRFGPYSIPLLLTELIELPTKSPDRFVTQKIISLATLLVEHFSHIPECQPTTATAQATTTTPLPLATSSPNVTSTSSLLFPTQTFSASLGNGTSFPPALEKASYHQAWAYLQMKEYVRDQKELKTLLREYGVTHAAQLAGLTEDQLHRLSETLHVERKWGFISILKIKLPASSFDEADSTWDY